ncbi:MAG: phytanoyl-CoA dioxygenase family protein [Cyanobacteria bacterium J06592_8]
MDNLWQNPPNDLLVAVRGNRPQPFSELRDKSCRGVGVRLLDIHSHSESAKQLYLHSKLHRYCQLIYNQKPVATQTLYFEYGSNQPLHRDPFYVITNPPSNVLASWIALEDITADSGPLNYVPESHKLPYYRLKTGDIILNDFKVTQQEKDQSYTYMYEMMDKYKLQKKPFYAKKGQAFLWHASLVHGGSTVENPSQTRKSLVTHYDIFINHPSQSQRVFFESKKPSIVTTQKLAEKDGWIGFENPFKQY